MECLTLSFEVFPVIMNAEQQRLEQERLRQSYWRRWGPYLSERQWGTVREDYSATGEAWDYFPHDHARSRAYRWGEDGILGISDNHQRLCFALALWNERDPILKERMFGLTGTEGNHGEDVKEYYFLPRRHAVAFLPEGALQIPTNGLSVRKSHHGKSSPGASSRWSTNCWIRAHFQRKSVF